MTDAQRARVIEAAQGWLNTPYHHKARVKGAGVDCAQLLIGVYAEAGLIDPFDTGDYPMDWMLHREEERFLLWLEHYCDVVASPLPGDIAIWRYGRTFSHGAIVTDWPTIIHAWRPAGRVVIGSADEEELAGRPVRLYRIKE
ncbi:MAG: hypothetical protein HYZ46_08335 [Nitrosomonadales bacterium]|nr:hypothetical protein [Nitrosomonadales bacterium]